MHNWLKTGKGMVASWLDAVSPPTQYIKKQHESTAAIHRKSADNNKGGDAGVLFTCFNQHCSHVCCSAVNGFQIYRCKPFEQVFECRDVVPVQMTMLADTSLIAFLSRNQTQTPSHQHHHGRYSLQLYDMKRRKVLWSIPHIHRVLRDIRFMLNRTRLVVTLESHTLSIFDITNKMRPLHPSIATFDDSGMFDLCHDSDNCLLAYADPSARGRIGIIDAYNLQKRGVIEAHDSALQILKFNAQGTMLASASVTGTLIRVFETTPHALHSNMQRTLATFRRGTYSSKIQCLAFNASSTKLCASSLDSRTIHIFDVSHALRDLHQQQRVPVPSLSTLNLVADYLPVSIAMKHSMEHPRSCLDIEMKNMNSNSNEQCETRLQCGFLANDCVVVSTDSGHLYRYGLSSDQTGSSYKLLTEHSLAGTDVCDHQQTKIYQVHEEYNHDIEDDERKDEHEDNEPSPPVPDSPISQSPEIFHSNDSLHCHT